MTTNSHISVQSRILEGGLFRQERAWNADHYRRRNVILVAPGMEYCSMKISRLSVQNYRSLKDVEIEIADYTSFVGANGSGKSSTLYALQWFYEGGPLDAEDISSFTPPNDNEPLDESDEAIKARTVAVTVTFSDLTAQDRDRLREYGRGTSATFRKSWTFGDPKPKVVGNATQGPGFAAVRAMKHVGEYRPAYVALRTSVGDLPDLGKSPQKDEILDALAAWESDPAHSMQMVEIPDSDANHMFGIDGPNVLLRCSRLVLIPAAAEISRQVGSPGKGSALNDLIGTVMANAGAAARAAWLTKHAREIAELNSAVKDSVENSTSLQASRINTRLLELVPNASVTFTPDVPDWTPKGDATVTTEVTIDGATNDVSRQGHGIQRAIMIAMFQSLVPDEVLLTAAHTAGDSESEDDAMTRLAQEISNLPALVICIEEPEIYQHPVRARAFARVLATLANQFNTQVVIATHSPYFVRPEQFSSLRRFYLESGRTVTNGTSVDAVSTAANCDRAQVLKIVEKRLPTTFSEGFFADAIVLVEGETDKAVLEALAELLGQPMDSIGVSVLDVGSKNSLEIPYILFKELCIPTFVIADGDALGAKRKSESDPGKQAQVHESHKRATERVIEWLPSSTAAFGQLPCTFGGPTVIARDFAIWNDDIEEELNAWPSFVTALSNNNGRLRRKDLLAYRTAVLEANAGDLPTCLRVLIDTIGNFRAHSISPSRAASVEPSHPPIAHI